MDKSRQQFEDALKSGFNTKHLSLELQRENGCGTYRWGETERCWEMWQASRESLEVKLPNVSGIPHTNYDCGYRDGIEKCENILISNGVKIKNE
ncbi:hypothetical protein MNY64_04855 [Moellerella wisconsensis]|uniref:hypothetical protein n=1 Tax=Moellerella wisconsensis TaxID=158849 RepID=UPI001F4EEECB|nr:hypothetical protein [Moellerella wisconsensis]UNH28139.1 hypothetical protein MNY64_04855 [Moellerella wisconsensis]